MEEIVIRSAEESDAAVIAALLGELGYPSTREEALERLRAMQAGPENRVLVAVLDGEVVGVVATHPIPLLHSGGRVGRIVSLVVSERCRGRGIGSRLLRAAEEMLWEQGCVRIELTSNFRRVDAHRFYEREGYVTESRRFTKRRG